MIESAPSSELVRGRLHWYQVTTAELALLTAMAELSRDGIVCASRRRLAAYAKLSERQVDRLVNGWVDQRTGKRVPGLRERGVLTELSSFSGPRHRPPTYRLNEAALPWDPRMQRYLPVSGGLQC